jgi:hypothetical protein
VAETTLPNRKKLRKCQTTQFVREWLLDQRKAFVDNVLLKDEQISVGAYLDRCVCRRRFICADNKTAEDSGPVLVMFYSDN